MWIAPKKDAENLKVGFSNLTFSKGKSFKIEVCGPQENSKYLKRYKIQPFLVECPTK